MHVLMLERIERKRQQSGGKLRTALIERDLIYSELKKLYVTDPVFALWFKQRFT